ncbi:MAG: folate-binding protein YgfZ [Sulfuricaulis sp.]|uniref:CAF17-like 4Fe-4S cluster assembly/insertion protein YgfZ n=1 Tax=Sulfuricaulis sp. TaxID=2003553 RepID=UPI0025D01D89|nr:folate-binding protein YgfZ [Sulfuricaulis sp.]MCR4347258.1 folate-binding protein YgfZ [Sulfuricaulis sp.]
MINAWKSFIQSQGAILEDERVQHFGNPAIERRAAAQGNVLVDLSELSLIRARGADTQNFLNGQFSNDLRSLDATHNQLSSWCSPKGRMLVIFRLFRRGDDTLLQLPAALLETTLKRLKMFVMRAKVTLDPVNDELVGFGISGPDAEKLLHDATGFAPGSVDGCETRDEITIARLPGPHPRFEIIAATDVATKLWNSLKAKATPVGPSAWAWLDIMAGIPSVHPETSDVFVPQMANLEIVGGVNFKKGCYPGQEIVARMQYLGKLKQRMYRAHVENDALPRPGDAIFAPDFPGQSAGTVVAAQPAPDNGFDLLAVIQISSAEAGKLHHGSENGPRLSLQNLPYPVAPATRAE